MSNLYAFIICTQKKNHIFILKIHRPISRRDLPGEGLNPTCTHTRCQTASLFVFSTNKKKKNNTSNPS